METTQITQQSHQAKWLDESLPQSARDRAWLDESLDGTYEPGSVPVILTRRQVLRELHSHGISQAEYESVLGMPLDNLCGHRARRLFEWLGY